MKVFTNYSFVTRNEKDEVGQFVDYRTEKDSSFYLLGKILGRSACTITSSVQTIDGDIVTTRSGSVYKFEKINTDYADFIYAIDNNIPIIRNWNISGNLKQGYYLHGYNGKDSFCGNIIQQEGNFLYCLSDSQKSEIKVFVDWFTSSYNTLSGLNRLTGTLPGTDIPLRHFEPVCHINNCIRPIIFYNKYIKPILSK